MMNGNDKKKIAMTVVKQFVPQDVNDVEFDPSLGFEACASDIMEAIKEDNPQILATALKSLAQIIKESGNYSTEG